MGILAPGVTVLEILSNLVNNSTYAGIFEPPALSELLAKIKLPDNTRAEFNTLIAALKERGYKCEY